MALLGPSNVLRMLSSLDSDKSNRAERMQEQMHEQLMWSMRTLSSILLSEDVSTETRDYLKAMMSGIFDVLPPPLKIGAQALMKAAKLTPEQKAMETFDRQFPAPQPPVDKDGIPLARNTDNEAAWASYTFDKMDWLQRRAISAYGVEKGKELVKIPKLMRMSADSKSWWMRDPQTRMVMSLPLAAAGVDIDKAIGWGYTVAGMSASGQVPVMEPKMLTIDGGQARVGLMFDTTTGKKEIEVTPFGGGEPQPLNKDIRDGWVASILGDDAIENLSGGAKNFAKLLTAKTKFGSLSELVQYEAALQEFVDSMDPTVRVFGNYNVDKEGNIITGEGTGLVQTLLRSYEFEGAPWRLVRTNGYLSFLDRNGKGGKFYSGLGLDGKPVPLDGRGLPFYQAIGKPDGAVIDVDFFLGEPGAMPFM